LILLLRINVAILLTLAAALAITVMLNHVKFREILSTLSGSRVSVITLDIAKRLESATDLGLPLRNISESASILEATVKRDDELMSATIFDDEGRVLFHGSRDATTAAAEKVPDSWVAKNAATRGVVWQLSEDDAFVVGAPVFNSFGKLEGGVIVRYSRDRFVGTLDALLSELGEAAALIFLGIGLLVVAGSAISLRRLLKVTQAVEREVEHVFDPAPDAARPEEGERNAVGLATYRDSVRGTVDALAEVEADIKRAGARP